MMLEVVKTSVEICEECEWLSIVPVCAVRCWRPSVYEFCYQRIK